MSGPGKFPRVESKPTHLPAYLPTYPPIYLSTYLPIYLPTYLSTYLSTGTRARRHAGTQARRHAGTQAFPARRRPPQGAGASQDLDPGPPLDEEPMEEAPAAQRARSRLAGTWARRGRGFPQVPLTTLLGPRGNSQRGHLFTASVLNC